MEKETTVSMVSMGLEMLNANLQLTLKVSYYAKLSLPVLSNNKKISSL